MGFGRKFMKKLRMALYIGLILGMIFSLVQDQAGAADFIDDLGRKISVENPEKVAAASASLAECWLLAGGEICAVTNDAFDERNLALDSRVMDLGGLKEPSMEVILAARPDLLILSSTLSKQLAMDDTLTRAKVCHAYFDTESFEDYLALLDIFTDLTGRKDLYAENGTDLIPVVESAIERGRVEEGTKVLALRASTVKIKALNSETMVGSMLREFGCENIADSDANLLTELSLEAIARENPDYIFITCMGDTEEAIARMEGSYGANPVWQGLDAVKNGRCFYLEKELFHYKPNGRWGESYEKLAELLSQN